MTRLLLKIGLYIMLIDRLLKLAEEQKKEDKKYYTNQQFREEVWQSWSPRPDRVGTKATSKKELKLVKTHRGFYKQSNQR